MQVNYTNDVDVNGTNFSVYAVIDGPKDNEYHLFDAYVNAADLTINVRGLGDGMPLVPTTGQASATVDMVDTGDGVHFVKKARVNGGSVRSYVTSRAGRLTAMAYAVGVKLATVPADSV